MSYHAIINSPVGKLGIVVAEEKLLQLDYVTSQTSLLDSQNKFAEKVVTQLQHYFNDSNYSFTIPLYFEGTTHQQSVWQALQKIPQGKIKTYGQLAQQLKSSPRAIGNACRRNPIPIIVPCHRIVAANHIGGYSGHTEGEILARKKWLLHHEGITV